jgi:hypothetical protein
VQNLKSNSNRSNLTKLAAASEAAELRDALCETELRDCQRTLHEYEIKKSLRDGNKLRAMLKIRSFVYGRMADIYAIKEDNIMADYYRLLEDAIHSAVIQGELSKQQNSRKSSRGKTASQAGSGRR